MSNQQIGDAGLQSGAFALAAGGPAKESAKRAVAMTKRAFFTGEISRSEFGIAP